MENIGHLVDVNSVCGSNDQVVNADIFQSDVTDIYEWGLKYFEIKKILKSNKNLQQH